MRVLGVAGLLALLALFAARLVDTAERSSFTADEPHYVGTALYLWESGDYHFARSLGFHPPLAFHLAGLPLLALDLDHLERSRGIGSQLVHGTDPPSRRVRWLSRLPFVALACWGAVLVFAWAREVAGTPAGLLAVSLYTFSPMLLGFGPLAHSDITVTVFYLQTLYACWRWWQRPTRLRVALCGISLGLALLAKLSALLLLGTLVLLVLAITSGRIPPLAPPAARAGEAPRARFAWGAAQLAAMLAIAVAIVWLGYGGSFAAEEVEKGALAGHVLPGYLHALLFDAEANTSGRAIYFFGEIGSGRWYHLPVAFLLKTPIPVLALLALALATRGSSIPGIGTFLGVGILVYVLAACFLLQVPLGLRYLLPIYPLLHVFIGTRLAPWTSPWRGSVVLAAAAWLACSSLSIHPHYIAYFNELLGGPSQAHRYLVESNLDWGQDLGTLARYMEARGNPPLHLAYFGPEKASAYGLDATPMTDCRPLTGLVAVSATLLRGVYALRRPFRAAPEGCFDWLLEHEPVAQPGYSILLFDIPPESPRAGGGGA